MIIFSEDMEIARPIPAMMASYLASLLEAGKSKTYVCSIISPVKALSFSPRPAPVYHEAPSMLESTSRIRLVPFLVEEFLLKIQPVFAPSMPSEDYTGYRTHSFNFPLSHSS